MQVYKQFHAELLPRGLLFSSPLPARAVSESWQHLICDGRLVCIPLMWDMDGLPSSTENFLLPTKKSLRPLSLIWRCAAGMKFNCDETFHWCFYTYDGTFLAPSDARAPRNLLVTGGRSHHTLMYSLLTTLSNGWCPTGYHICLSACVFVGYVCCCPASGVRVSHRDSWQQVHLTHSHTHRETRDIHYKPPSATHPLELAASSHTLGDAPPSRHHRHIQSDTRTHDLQPDATNMHKQSGVGDHCVFVHQMKWKIHKVTVGCCNHTQSCTTEKLETQTGVEWVCQVDGRDVKILGYSAPLLQTQRLETHVSVTTLVCACGRDERSLEVCLTVPLMSPTTQQAPHQTAVS